jgi:peptidoglycan lytic transglycosylase G
LRRYHKARRRNLRDLGARLKALWPSGSSPSKRRRDPEKRRRKSPAGRLVLVALLIVGVLYGLYLLASAVFGGGDEASATVVVEEGDTLASVADKLEEAGIINSPTLFKLEARIKGESTGIKPGEYRLTPGEGSGEILKTLTSGDSDSTFSVTITEGLTLDQTAQKVAEQGSIPAEEFEAAAKKTDYGYAFLDDPAIQTTEGFLFPKKYKFEKGTDASQIVDRLLQQYSAETRDLDFAGAQKRFNLTGYELVTTASLIEKEAASPEERPLVASVIYNRIRAGMPLQVDATVQYAIGKPKDELSLDDLEVESPYNTYKHPGLPPGPIASPGRESIEAALEPAETDYLYYVLEADGKKHFFTDDYDEFLAAKAEAKGARP